MINKNLRRKNVFAVAVIAVVGAVIFFHGQYLGKSAEAQVAPTKVIAQIRANCSSVSGACYTSISAWQAAFGGIDFASKGCAAGDLVCANTIASANLYNDWPNGLVDNPTIAGWRTDSSRYVELVSPQGQHHRGVAGTGFRLNGSIKLNAQNVRLLFLEIFGGGVTTDGPYGSGNGSIIYSCIIHDFTSPGAALINHTADGSAIIVINTILYGLNQNGWQNGGLIVAKNANIMNVTGFGSSRYGIQALGPVTVTNTFVANCATGCFSGSFSASSASNVSSDGTAAGSPRAINQIAYGTYFKSPLSAPIDFHLTADSQTLWGIPSVKMTAQPFDIDLDTRKNWDIGADEFILLPPTAPSNLSGVATSTTALLSWMDNSTNEQGFNIEKSTNGTTFTLLATTTASFYSDNNLSPRTYFYRVNAFNAAGASSYSNTASVTIPDTEAPSIPTNLLAQASSSQVTVAWNSSTDNVGVAGYQVFRNGSLLATTTIARYVDMNVLPSTLYTYNVAAFDAAGNVSRQSSALSIQTPPPASSLPNPPSNLTARATSTPGVLTVELGWLDNSTNELGFSVERSRDGVAFGALATTTVNHNAYTDAVNATGTFFYRVRAFNNFGFSAYSNVASTTLQLPPPPPPGGNPDPTILPDDPLCQGLVQDKNPHPMTALAKPALGQAITDPQFGTTIRRITDVSTSEGSNAVLIPMYSTIQAWNADESLMILWHRGQGHELYDGKTYQFIRSLNFVSPTDIEQILWDPVDPDVLYYPSNYNAIPNFYRYHVSTGVNEVIRNFGDVCPTGDWGKLLGLGSDPLYLSWTNHTREVGLHCGSLNFLYDIGTNTITGETTSTLTTAPQPGPAGQFAFWAGDIFNSAMNFVRHLDIQSGFEHASVGRGRDGHDTYNAVVFDPPAGGNEVDHVGTLVRFDMDSTNRRVIIGEATGWPYPPGGTHISAIGYKRPGWVAASIVGNVNGQGVLSQEVVLANTDNGTVCRVAHHRSFAGEGQWGYWGEPHVVLSPSATRLLFASDWGNGPSVDSYVVELPSYTP